MCDFIHEMKSNKNEYRNGGNSELSTKEIINSLLTLMVAYINEFE